jgi:hypothetical protein
MSTVTQTQRKKLGKGTWMLLIVLGVAIIVFAVLHFVGIINLGFIGDWAINFASFGTASGWNAAIVLGIPFIIGVLFFYTLKAYFIGEKVTTVTQVGGYNPLPTTPAQSQQQGKETTISA